MDSYKILVTLPRALLRLMFEAELFILRLNFMQTTKYIEEIHKSYLFYLPNVNLPNLPHFYLCPPNPEGSTS